MTESVSERIRGGLLGLAVGDAVGTTVEFRARGSFTPVTDLVGGGPFHLEAGQWTDDTSMALCLAESLVAAGFDLRDQIERYCRWYEEGYWSSTGQCFDIGSATRQALHRYRKTGDPAAGSADPHTAGNGCIMRLAPVPIYFFPDVDEAAEHAALSCVTTHAAAECLDAARLLGRVLVRALGGGSRQEVLAAGADCAFESPRISHIAAGAYLQKPESLIRGSGYVVESLEAALWSFATTETFEAAILRAVNLGDDADTTAAICGQVAGAFYGAPGIPADWLQRLHQREVIESLADRLRQSAHSRREAAAPPHGRS
jgi:ADP-ribosyl-[dinitrogen reductase] hydrolase